MDGWALLISGAGVAGTWLIVWGNSKKQQGADAQFIKNLSVKIKEADEKNEKRFIQIDGKVKQVVDNCTTCIADINIYKRETLKAFAELRQEDVRIEGKFELVDQHLATSDKEIANTAFKLDEAIDKWRCGK